MGNNRTDKAKREQEQREQLRRHEDGVLRAAKRPGATRQTIEAARQIAEHRAAGNHTTQHR